MSLSDHPGYLGLTSHGVVAIHADWPLYPVEHGWLAALATLGSFPQETRFSSISDIDRCVLLLADDLQVDDDPFSERNFHAALWHDDLLELTGRGWVVGAVAVTERIGELNKRRELVSRPPVTAWPEEGVEAPNSLVVAIPGEAPRPVELRPLSEYDDESSDWVCFPPASRLAVTDAGWHVLDEELARLFAPPAKLRPRLDPILAAHLYDTAVREVSVSLEVAMRDACGETGQYGQRLVDRYTDYLCKQMALPAARLKTLRGELRTAMRFVRNEYAHTNPDTPRARGLSLLSRLSELCDVVDELAALGELDS